jgi:hypothetical protein
VSRSGYSDDVWGSEYNLYRGAVDAAIYGKRGQQMLRELRDALDAMPVKRLVRGELETTDGEVCALGCLGRTRGVDMGDLDPDDAKSVAKAFNIAESLAREVVFLNDEDSWSETPEQRWQQMRSWCDKHIRSAS